MSDNTPQDPCENFPPDVDPLICPRRCEGVAPSFVGDHDAWETNRWNHPKHESKWPEELGTPPRTCSFCGGVHPKDVIRMIKEGWEINPSDKNYKWYIEPPGSMLHHKRIMGALGDKAKEKEAFNTPHHVVTPPVKLYGQHGTPEQLKELNSLLNLQRRGQNE